jgi:hypothetical protein
MASVARSLSISGMQSGTICPPHIRKQQKGLGRFCVKISMDVIDANGMRRMTFKGYGPEKDVIVKRTLAAQDKHKREEDCVTDPFITTIDRTFVTCAIIGSKSTT